MRLLFHLGADAGFFSEYNNMLLAIIYCKLNNIRFSLASKNAPFSYNKGWDDYFLPFCKEYNPHYNKKFNRRYDAYIDENNTDKVKRLYFNLLCWLHGIDMLTYQIFYKARELSVTQLYNIPDLAGNATLAEHCRVLNEQIYRFNETTQLVVDSLIEKASLPSEYLAVHIRRGDKQREIAHHDIRCYMDKLQSLSDCHNVFVATDDYTVFTELQRTYKDYSFYTLTSPSAVGYDQRTFEQKSPERRRDEMYALFADIEILKHAKQFSGTLSSNIGMYLYIVMPQGTCHGVDYNDWRIW